MSCPILLYTTDFSVEPTRDEEPEFFERCGTEYEANTRIPLFWLCLYDAGDVRLHTPEPDEDGVDGVGDAAADAPGPELPEDDGRRPRART